MEPVASALSWCKTEVRVGNPKNVAKITDGAPESPALCVMSVHLQTVLNERERCNEIVMISALCHPEVSIEGQTERPEGRFFSFTGVRKLESQAWPLDLQQRVEEANRRDAVAPKTVHPNERALLNFFLAKVHTVDPDVIVGHNFMGFDLDVLLHRMQRAKIPAWSKLGRLRRNAMPKLQARRSASARRSPRPLHTHRIPRGAECGPFRGHRGGRWANACRNQFCTPCIRLSAGKCRLRSFSVNRVPVRARAPVRACAPCLMLTTGDGTGRPMPAGWASRRGARSS